MPFKKSTITDVARVALEEHGGDWAAAVRSLEATLSGHAIAPKNKRPGRPGRPVHAFRVSLSGVSPVVTYPTMADAADAYTALRAEEGLATPDRFVYPVQTATGAGVVGCGNPEDKMRVYRGLDQAHDAHARFVANPVNDGRSRQYFVIGRIVMNGRARTLREEDGSAIVLPVQGFPGAWEALRDLHTSVHLTYSSTGLGTCSTHIPFIVSKVQEASARAEVSKHGFGLLQAHAADNPSARAEVYVFADREAANAEASQSVNPAHFLADRVLNVV